MKTLTFSIMSSILFGIEEGDQRRDALVKLFQHMTDGIFTIPVNLSFTRFNRSLKASKKVRAMLMNLIREKEAALEKHTAFPNQDLISCLLSIRNESVVLTYEEIIDNATIVMIEGHNTSAILLTFFIRLLANDPSVYATIALGMIKKKRIKRSFVSIHINSN